MSIGFGGDNEGTLASEAALPPKSGTPKQGVLVAIGGLSTKEATVVGLTSMAYSDKCNLLDRCAESKTRRVMKEHVLFYQT